MTMILPTINLVTHCCSVLEAPWKFTRSSVGGYITQGGALANASIDVPRFTSDASTGDFYGLAIENPITNLIKNSGKNNRLFTVGNGWATTGGTVTSINTGIRDISIASSPNSSATYVPNASTITTTLSNLTANQSHIFSVYVRAYPNSKIIGLQYNGTSIFSGTVGSSQGWKRIYGVFTPTTTSGTIGFVTNGSIELDYAQVEVSNLSLPTTSSDGLVAVDNLYILQNDVGSLINQFEGTIYMQFRKSQGSKSAYPSNANTILMTFGLDKTFPTLSVNNVAVTQSKLQINYNLTSATGNANINVLADSILVGSNIAVTETDSFIGAIHKVAITYSTYTGKIYISVDGSVPLSGAWTSKYIYHGLPDPAYALSDRFLSITGGNTMYNHIAYFPQALSITDLQAITTL